MTWTTPADLAAQVQRLWDHGRILAAGLTGETLFPLALRLSQPSPRELGEQFESVRNWIRALEEGAKPVRGYGYEIAWKDTNNRQLGRNRIPVGVAVPTRADALALVGRTEAAELFEALARATRAGMPELEGWLARKPLLALEHAADWQHILDVLAWFRANPRSGLYLRQIDIAGIDTKFIEVRKGLLTELLDIVLPPDAVDPMAIGFKGFGARYGLRTKPNLIRFRILDARLAISDLTDLTAYEVKVPELETSVFIIPSEIVKNGDERLVVLNRVAASVVEARRGYHQEAVFSYNGHPVARMLNSAWRNARMRAGLPMVRVHDLKHTFGRRLRAAGVGFEDRQDLLGHRSNRITTHYSAAELAVLIEAANRVCEYDQRRPQLTILRGVSVERGHKMTTGGEC